MQAYKSSSVGYNSHILIGSYAKKKLNHSFRVTDVVVSLLMYNNMFKTAEIMMINKV